MNAKRVCKLITLRIPWLVIWLLGTACALISDLFGTFQDWLREMAEELNEAIQKL